MQGWRSRKEIFRWLKKKKGGWGEVGGVERVCVRVGVGRDGGGGEWRPMPEKNGAVQRERKMAHTPPSTCRSRTLPRQVARSTGDRRSGIPWPLPGCERWSARTHTDLHTPRWLQLLMPTQPCRLTKHTHTTLCILMTKFHRDILQLNKLEHVLQCQMNGSHAMVNKDQNRSKHVKGWHCDLQSNVKVTVGGKTK